MIFHTYFHLQVFKSIHKDTRLRFETFDIYPTINLKVLAKVLLSAFNLGRQNISIAEKL